MTGDDKRWTQECRFAALGEFVLLRQCVSIPKRAELFTALQALGRYFTQGYLKKAKIP